MEESIRQQFEGVRQIRSAALGRVLAHRLEASPDDTFTCACGYGLGDASGDLEGRYSAHLAEVRA